LLKRLEKREREDFEMAKEEAVLKELRNMH